MTGAPGAPGAPNASLLVPVGPGELVDKITILVIKSDRITAAAQRENVRRELRMLEDVRDAALPASDELARLTAELRAVNEALWDVEDALRDCERRGDFGPRFVELARSVYKTNDRRAALKRQVNDLLGAAIIEEKSYAEYPGDH
jgi:hypothetical protein